jgi:3-oxoadipate enol-lactonase
MHVHANGISFHYEIDGREGAPWLILSNSLATNLSMWDPQVAALAKRHRVLRYDQRGHGATEATPGRYTFDLLIDDVLALMQVLGIERASYVGVSMGGATGFGLAQKHPDKVERLVVADSPCTSTPATAKQWEERIEVARTQGIEPLVQSTLERWFPAATLQRNPPHVAKVREMIRTTPAAGFIGCAAALAEHDFRSTISQVKAPTLFMVGAADGTTPAAMRQMQKDLPGSEFVELPDAGHISNLDQPAMFTDALTTFLA